MRKLSMSKAIREAMHEEMVRDENVIVIGEDLGKMGSPFGVTLGFLDEFGPNRVIETPICESGFTGMAVGAAMRGIRPVVELMYVDFVGVAADPIINQAAKMRYMTGGQVSIPMVIRAPMGAGRRNAGQHSQCLETYFTHIPGLKLVCPSTPAEAKGLLKAAIRDDDPVVFLEHKLLYADKGEMPEEEQVIPLGLANVKREGKDVTIIAWSRQVLFALEAAKELEKDGIDVEVIDLRTLVPLDWEAIKKSVCKTHNVVIAQEGYKRSGFAGEIATQIMEELFDELDSPVERVAGLNTVPPYSPPLEDVFFPNSNDIVRAAKKVVSYKLYEGAH
ncbi:alpha-ketoacid dehydrogenase subunit beta [Priestia megaterium]|uniref:alpha-ketoacid dehydrogenase subunit beta n=1 Tax=Priestia megaterium TaxID=1404 RepID=UPI00177F7C8D|nr:alpha-ketoacid dehydrogenase subunit beta [Priestia megaterium]MBD8847884.1 alpha-ketoacid dehydrogenase subunit beta [Priestia megaterium]MCF6799808.1 alpha-ketoacid dehydrogenase subunit beta [Bacillus sp. ET1]MDN4866019.1 alpha-ketoacid dehydrogenase subunit beta [Priestia megaterium]MED4184241.1 alpha-ketoacid dehydrogenase subunit beta [Priestia megaterium]